MDQDKVEDYCKEISEMLSRQGREVPVGGIVTENYYVYPFERDHLLDFGYGNRTT